MSASIFGYEFSDPSLLDEALTTPSYRMDKREAKDNQRLEFLGDAVLNFIAANRLYSANPDLDEGALTVRRAQLVSSASLCAAAKRTTLARRLRRNKAAHPLPANSKIIADAVEAVIGAAWLDGGLAAAEKMFDFLHLEELVVSDVPWAGNPKGELQIVTQAMEKPVLPEYKVVSVAGKPHEPVFTVEVTVDGLGTERAKAGSRKEAEALAAAKMLASAKEKGLV